MIWEILRKYNQYGHVTNQRLGYFPGFWLRGWVGPVINRTRQ